MSVLCPVPRDACSLNCPEEFDPHVDELPCFNSRGQQNHPHLFLSITRLKTALVNFGSNWVRMTQPETGLGTCSLEGAAPGSWSQWYTC